MVDWVLGLIVVTLVFKPSVVVIVVIVVSSQLIANIFMTVLQATNNILKIVGLLVSMRLFVARGLVVLRTVVVLILLSFFFIEPLSYTPHIF